MRLDRSLMKKLLFLITFAIALAWLFFHMDFTTRFFRVAWGLVYPFILGFILAFLFNIPMKKVEHLVFRNRQPRLRRPVGFALTLLLLLLALALVIFIIVPQLVQTVSSLVAQTPGYISRLQDWLAPYSSYIPQLGDWIHDADLDWNGIAQKLLGGLSGGGTDVLNSAFGFASSLFSGVVNFFIGAIFACYLVLGKEKLTAQLTAVLQAYMPAEKFEQLHALGSRSSLVFSKFVGGQCTEALLVGVLFTIVLWVGGFEYALLIGTLAGIMNLVPIFGGYIALGVGALLTLVSMGGVRTLVFIAVFFLIQQIDGNIIYPRVVGSSVGLSSVWVLVAVTVGGSLFGIVGILFVIPLASIFYALLAGATTRRLAKKGIRYRPAGPPKKQKKHRHKWFNK